MQACPMAWPLPPSALSVALPPILASCLKTRTQMPMSSSTAHTQRWYLAHRQPFFPGRTGRTLQSLCQSHQAPLLRLHLEARRSRLQAPKLRLLVGGSRRRPPPQPRQLLAARLVAQLVSMHRPLLSPIQVMAVPPNWGIHYRCAGTRLSCGQQQLGRRLRPMSRLGRMLEHPHPRLGARSPRQPHRPLPAPREATRLWPLPLPSPLRPPALRPSLPPSMHPSPPHMTSSSSSSGWRRRHRRLLVVQSAPSPVFRPLPPQPPLEPLLPLLCPRLLVAVPRLPTRTRRQRPLHRPPPLQLAALHPYSQCVSGRQ